MKTIAHVWADYLPNSFIEPHPYLLRTGSFNSINLAAVLRENRSEPDGRTHFLKAAPLGAMVSPSLLERAKNKLTRPWLWRRYNRFCDQTLRRENASLIHAHIGTTAARLLPLLSGSPLPKMVTFYGADASAALKDPRLTRAYQKMFGLMDRVMVLCEAVKQRLSSLGCDPGKITVWNLPAGIESYPYQPRERGEGPVSFVCAARFVEKKGHLVLIEAFNRLVRSGRAASDPRLTLVGYGGLRGRIEQRIRELGIEDRVTLIDTEAKSGFAELYNGILRKQHIFVLPSTTASDGDDEGGPALTLVCAQAAGLPVICTPFPGSEISVTHGETGLLVPDGDSEALYSRMAELAEHPQQWNRLGKAASQLVRSKFSEESQMSILVDIYRELLQRNAP